MQIVASMDNLSTKFDEPAKQFEGFQTMMKQTLDTLSAMTREKPPPMKHSEICVTRIDKI